jgi:hypothetical protein
MGVSQEHVPGPEADQVITANGGADSSGPLAPGQFTGRVNPEEVDQ